jgi:cation:H+ antiporter
MLNNIILLVISFVALGVTADLAVRNIKYLGAILKTRLFVFGIILGFITTLPELSLGLNAIIEGAPALSIGNLLGGIMVIFGLVLGVSLILNRRIVTDGGLMKVIPSSLIIFSPILLGFDGRYDFRDGLLMVAFYFGLIIYLYYSNHTRSNNATPSPNNRQGVAPAIFWALAGVVGILISSHWVVKITLDLLEQIQVSRLFVGLIIFSLGTNLPEISITFVSWRKKASELSLSYLLSSAFTNVLALGILASIHPLIFRVDLFFWSTAIFLGLILVMFTYFYYSEKKMDRLEGFILLFTYLLFLLVTFWLI